MNHLSMNSFVVLLASLLKDVMPDMECGICPHVTNPAACMSYTTCGPHEVCFTSEFKDHDGNQAFHMGCELQERCHLFATTAHNTSNTCYNCCENPRCNQNLCGDALIHTTTPTPKVCPDFFLPRGSHCYFFGGWQVTWAEGRQYCRSQGGDLASVLSSQEAAFLGSELYKLGAPITSYWLGGFYSPAAHEWEWADRSPFTYAFWAKGHPPATFNHNRDYYTVLLEPDRSRRSYWNVTSSTSDRAFICKKSIST